MVSKVKCIVEGCGNLGKVWVNKEGPFCYTHHHENREKYINNNNVNKGNIVELDPLL